MARPAASRLSRSSPTVRPISSVELICSSVSRANCDSALDCRAAVAASDCSASPCSFTARAVCRAIRRTSSPSLTRPAMVLVCSAAARVSSPASCATCRVASSGLLARLGLLGDGARYVLRLLAHVFHGLRHLGGALGLLTQPRDRCAGSSSPHLLPCSRWSRCRESFRRWRM